MEGREGNGTSGVTVVESNAQSDYKTGISSTQFPGSTPQISVTTAPPDTVAGGAGVAIVKKKRGRPRKYAAADGSAIASPKPAATETVTKNVVMSPKPISSLSPSPPVIDFSSENKRGKFQPVSSIVKSHQPRLEPVNNLSNGARVASPVVGSVVAATNFTPHIITVNTGEDVTMKIISFSQQGPRAICILSANGVISSVTLRQPDSSGGTLTYEGRFEILSLTGSFMPSETGGLKNRSGGMSVSLASPDGRVVGGGVAGLLIAAGPIQIVVGSFLAGNAQEQTPKLQKPDHVAVTTAHTAGFTITSGETEQPYHSSPSFRGENWPSPIPAPPLASESTRKPTDINVTLAG